MKKTLFIAILLIATLGVRAQSEAQLTAQISQLQATENHLKKQIETEDRKRNAPMRDATPEYAEQQNDRQDSICLSLRSQLVNTQLQIAEANRSLANLKKQNSNRTNDPKKDDPQKPTNPNNASHESTIHGAIHTIKNNVK